ncbi:MAG: VOC family protein [Pseudomonadota bacterium]
MQKITPSLWFNDGAEEETIFYISIFKISSRYASYDENA